MLGTQWKPWYKSTFYCTNDTLQWRQNGHDSVSNHQPRDCLLNRLFRRRSKKTSKLRVTGLCVGNSPVPGEFPAQRASNAENVSIWWRHHDQRKCCTSCLLLDIHSTDFMKISPLVPNQSCVTLLISVALTTQALAWIIWISIGTREWIRNHINLTLWDEITHLCSNFNGG